MEYPIMREGRKVGLLRLSPDGLYTRFDAAAEDCGELARLWLFGEGGASFCLGVMLPVGGRVCLSRRLSRLELEKLPRPLCHAALNAAAPAQPLPAPAISAAPEWLTLPDGSLLSADGSRLALPAALRRRREGLRMMEHEGLEYIVFFR